MVSEVKRRDVQESKNIDYAKQYHTPHYWLPAKVMYAANQAFLLVDSFNFNFVDEERSDIHNACLLNAALFNAICLYNVFFCH